MLFDAIEFNEQLATVDVLLDIAFVLMDLLHRGKRRAANRLFNSYLSSMGQLEEQELSFSGLALLPLFLAIRATVRAHVRARLSKNREGTPEGEQSAAEARR